jgi:hypothetical protein
VGTRRARSAFNFAGRIAEWAEVAVIDAQDIHAPAPQLSAPDPRGEAMTAAPPERRPRLPTRLVVAVVVGILLGTLGYLKQVQDGGCCEAHDFTYVWRATRALRDGQNPYTVIRSIAPYPYDGVFVYPLPAAVVALPLSGLLPPLAAGVMLGLAFTLLTYALTRDGFGRLSILLSVPVVYATMLAQWSPLLVAAALLPPLSGLLLIKPTIGVALGAYALSRRTLRWGLAGGALLLTAAFIANPHWVGDWLRTAALNPLGTQYIAPVQLLGGPVLLLALLRWRRPEARLLAVLACVPQNYFWYDQLPVFLVAKSWREAAALTVCSHLAYMISPPGPIDAGWRAINLANGQAVMALIYLPALLMVVGRANEGPVPRWLERLVARATTGASARWRRRRGLRALA